MKNHNKFWIVFSFLMVFAAGLFGGIILEKQFFDQNSSRTGRTERKNSGRRNTTRFPTLDTLAQELQLAAEQQAHAETTAELTALKDEDSGDETTTAKDKDKIEATTKKVYAHDKAAEEFLGS